MTLGGAVVILLAVFLCLIWIENDNKNYQNKK